MSKLFLFNILLLFHLSIFGQRSPILIEQDTCELERIFILLKLQNVQAIDSTIKVDLRYASTHNFMKMNMYGDLNRAYLQKEVAWKLVYAQKLLKDTFPNYSLIIFDATRPVSIQQLMWDKIKVPAKKKSKYLSNPKYGSLHNYGAAVDVSIVDENGKLLDMATGFDSFKKLAYPFYQEQYYKSGKLSKAQYLNRRLLQSIMKKAGFMGITTEWWHYNSCYRKEAQKRYPKVYSHHLAYYQKAKKEIPDQATTTINDTDSLVFRVQIMTSGKARNLSWHKLRHQADYAYFHKGLYKYTSGQFKTMKSANDYKNKMRKKGFKGSFVVPFYQGKRISIKDASELMQ